MVSHTSFTYFSSCQLMPSGPGGKLSVVRLQGEHDIATRDVLAATIARAIARNEPAVVIDLSEVQFMSAAALGVIVAARQFLRRRSRSLVLRAPSPCVVRIFAVCGLNELFDQNVDAEVNDVAKGALALASWVEVPVTDRVDWRHGSPIPKPGVFEQARVPVHLPIGRRS